MASRCARSSGSRVTVFFNSRGPFEDGGRVDVKGVETELGGGNGATGAVVNFGATGAMSDGYFGRAGAHALNGPSGMPSSVRRPTAIRSGRYVESSASSAASTWGRPLR